MLTEERRQYILAQLQQHTVIKSKALMAALDASESTIRRDLDELEAAGELKRIHGGAKRINGLGDDRMSRANLRRICAPSKRSRRQPFVRLSPMI